MSHPKFGGKEKPGPVSLPQPTGCRADAIAEAFTNKGRCRSALPRIVAWESQAMGLENPKRPDLLDFDETPLISTGPTNATAAGWTVWPAVRALPDHSFAKNHRTTSRRSRTAWACEHKRPRRPALETRHRFRKRRREQRRQAFAAVADERR